MESVSAPASRGGAGSPRSDSDERAPPPPPPRSVFPPARVRLGDYVAALAASERPPSPQFPPVSDIFGPSSSDGGRRDDESTRMDAVPAPGAGANSGHVSDAPNAPASVAAVGAATTGAPSDAPPAAPATTEPATVAPVAAPAAAPGDGYVLVLMSSLRETAEALAELEADVRGVRSERCVGQRRQRRDVRAARVNGRSA